MIVFISVVLEMHVLFRGAAQLSGLMLPSHLNLSLPWLFTCFTTFVSWVLMYGCTRVYPRCVLKVKGCWFSSPSPRVRTPGTWRVPLPTELSHSFCCCVFKDWFVCTALAGLGFVTLPVLPLTGITEPHACKAGAVPQGVTSVPST